MKERRYDIDWVRVVATLAVFVFHSVRFFDKLDWHLKNAQQSFFLRVRAKINPQILSVEAPAGQGAKAQEYQEYFELSQHRPAGCIVA
jgi:hypothetical protein